MVDKLGNIKHKQISVSELSKILGMAVSDLKAISEYMQSEAGEDAAITSKDNIDVDSLIELISSKSPGRPSNNILSNKMQDNDLSKQLQRLRREKEDDENYFD